MFRIDVTSASSTLPTPAAPGSPGYFQPPNTMNGTPGTTMSADWCNAVQEELCNIIETASITLDKSVRTQLLTAINTLIDNALAANTFSWNIIDADTDLAINNGYITNSGVDTVNLLLPATCAVGSIIKVVRYNGNFNIAQNDLQRIWCSTQSTTVGTTGYITPLANNASVELLCVEADTTFLVVNSQGAFEVR